MLPKVYPEKHGTAAVTGDGKAGSSPGWRPVRNDIDFCFLVFLVLGFLVLISFLGLQSPARSGRRLSQHWKRCATPGCTIPIAQLPAVRFNFSLRQHPLRR